MQKTILIHQKSKFPNVNKIIKTAPCVSTICYQWHDSDFLLMSWYKHPSQIISNDVEMTSDRHQ